MRTYLDMLVAVLQTANGNWVYRWALPFQPVCIQVNSCTSLYHLKQEWMKEAFKKDRQSFTSIKLKPPVRRESVRTWQIVPMNVCKPWLVEHVNNIKTPSIEKYSSICIFHRCVHTHYEMSQFQFNTIGWKLVHLNASSTKGMSEQPLAAQELKRTMLTSFLTNNFLEMLNTGVLNQCWPWKHTIT